MATHSPSVNFRSSQASLQSGQSMNLAKTLQVQDQIIEQLRADQSALREALEAERAALRDCQLASDRDMKAFQRETLQLNKQNVQKQMRIEELEKELAYAKEALAFEQKNVKALEKEQSTTAKELKLKMIKNFDKINKQEMLIDQLKSEVEDLKEALNSERNATNLLIREHNSEVKMLREEVKAKSTEAYRELKERATREREEYREMQEEAERTYKLLEKDFKEGLALKDEELRRVKAEAKLIQKELEDQLRASLKEPVSVLPAPPVNYVEMDKFKRLKNEVAVLKEQNRKLLNEIQVLTGEGKPNDPEGPENYVAPYNNAPPRNPGKTKKSLTSIGNKRSDIGVTRTANPFPPPNNQPPPPAEPNIQPSDYSVQTNPMKRQTKSSLSMTREESFRPYPKTKTEERYEELKRTMIILRKALQ